MNNQTMITEKQAQAQTVNRLRHIGFYFLVGPVIGFVVTYFFILLNVFFTTRYLTLDHVLSTLSFTLLIFVIGQLCAFIIGGLPAILTGLVASSCASPKLEKLATLTFGALVTFAGSLIISKELNVSLMLGALGGFAGVSCAYLRHRHFKTHY